MKSWEATRWAKKQRSGADGQTLTRSEKFLLLTLADYHHEGRGYAVAGVEVLAQDTALSTRQIRRLLHSLAEKKLLDIETTTGGLNRYVLRAPRELTGYPRPVEKPVDKSVDKSADPGHYVTPDKMSPLTSDVRGPLTPLCQGTPDTIVSPLTSIKSLRASTAVAEGDHFKKSSDREPRPKWEQADLWLKKFLDSEACFFIPIGTLDDPVWWHQVATACHGLSEGFLKESFAKLRARLLEEPEKTPETVREWKSLVRTWLCREDRWLQKNNASGK